MAGAGDGSGSGTPRGSGPLLTLKDQTALEPPPKRGGWRNIAGKVWNAPNTLIGVIYGGLGMGAGALAHLLAAAPAPKALWRDNALQFTNNPFGGVGALTLGNTTTWKGDPYDPADRIWRNADGSPKLENGHTYPQHETQHTYQGEQLGPLYLPSNLLGGLNAVIRGEGWHGDHNWNERGPQSQDLAPWAPRSR